MRKMMTLLIAGTLCVGAAGVDRADAAIDFRPASTTATSGFKVMNTGMGQFYVSPNTVLTGADVMAAGTLRDGSALTLLVSPAAAADVSASKRMADRLAVLVDGVLVGAARIRSAETNGRVVLTGLPAAAGQHVANLLSNTGAGASAAAVSIVPATDFAAPGDVITADLFIRGATDLKVFQMRVVATGVSTGRLPLVDITVDGSRSDYVFGSVQTIEAGDLIGSRLGGLIFDGTVNVSAPKYIGTVSFQTPARGADTYYINVEVGKDSFLRNNMGEPLQYRIAGPAVVTVGTPSSLGPRPSRTEK